MRQYLSCSENERCLHTCEYVLCEIGTGMEHPGLPGLAIIVRTGRASNSKLLLAQKIIASLGQSIRFPNDQFQSKCFQSSLQA